MDRLQHQLNALLLAALGACGGEAGAAHAKPAGIVDSILPREVALARFRAGLPEVTALTGGAPSQGALVRRFVQALERADMVTLQEVRLTRAEFAWLYYPAAPQGQPPYDLAPGLLWELLSRDSDRGLRRAVEEFGSRPLAFDGYSCDARESRQGDNTVAGPCTVRLNGGSHRLFGLIIERGGVHKFVSYANKL